ncbi:hypothetical protein CRN47_01855 [Vibrio vulnificus]|nr:hypothetical protein VV1062A_02936 [Vibrio vulnificus]POB28458.1 hypothetical protein CRN47_01855 [Vibrio vulnificus]
MRYLQDVAVGANFDGDGYVSENIERFLENLVKLDLKVTYRASWKLTNFHSEMNSLNTKNLDHVQAAKLSTIMNEIRMTLDAEIQGSYAFIATPKRLDSDKLLGDISSLFSPNIFENFPDIAKYDFDEAGKCIAFERPTAAAFHILRATEANLRYYYKQMIKQNRVKSEMWGPIIQDLRKKNKTKVHTTLNNHLDNIRVSFRNPTQHPEAIYDIHEVQDLLSVCIDANNRMFKVIAEQEC